MYIHPAMAEILEEERRRESYADARQYRMFERELLRLERGPGLLERAVAWLWARLVAAAQQMRAKFNAPVTHQTLQSERQTLQSERRALHGERLALHGERLALRSECETC